MLSGSALSQEIDECLECHADRNITETDSAGNVHNLYVDKTLYLESIHGKLDYTCVECHTDATLDHPAEGVPDVKCEECHEDVAKKYELSKHSKLLTEGNDKAPHCYDCHTMHYSLYSDDQRSSIHPDNIPETCAQCHGDIVNGPGIVGSAIVAQLKGHGKVNPAGEFRIDRCLDCHSEVTSHGPEEKPKPVCAKCHESANGSLTLGPIHKSEVFSRAPTRIAVKVFYGFGLAMVAFAFMSLAGKKMVKPKCDEHES
jgi:hypothetical protein